MWVRGEVSGFRGPAASGHCFFSLKDESGGATLRVKVFASDYRRIPFTLEEGLLVLARGTPDVYPERGELSLRIVEIQPSGIGALQLAFEQLKARLAAEGLFDPAKKRPLPLLPRRIGVVTSRHGAALRDILKVLDARFPNAHVTLYPASVQGAAAPGEIVRALRAFSRVPGAADVVIVARGGGSKEDLAAFNDEAVVRAVAASRVPVVSAVGHEMDVTLTDLAADVRAATPSQAAELVVERLDRFEERLARGETGFEDFFERENGQGGAPTWRGSPSAPALRGIPRGRPPRAASNCALRRPPSSLPFEESPLLSRRASPLLEAERRGLGRSRRASPPPRPRRPGAPRRRRPDGRARRRREREARRRGRAPRGPEPAARPRSRLRGRHDGRENGALDGRAHASRRETALRVRLARGRLRRTDRLHGGRS